MDFHGMKRKELQSLCKKHGIPANLTNREMSDRLASLLKEDENPVTKGESCLMDLGEINSEIDSVVVTKNVKKVRFSPENETFIFVGTDVDSDSESENDYNSKKNRGRKRRSMGKKHLAKRKEVRENPVRVTRSRGKSIVTEDSQVVSLVLNGKKRGRRGKESLDVCDKPPTIANSGDHVEGCSVSAKSKRESVRWQLRRRKVVNEAGGNEGDGDLEVSRKNIMLICSKKTRDARRSDGVLSVDRTFEENVIEEVVRPEKIPKHSKWNSTKGKGSSTLNEHLKKTDVGARTRRSQTRVNVNDSAVDGECGIVETQKEGLNVLQLEEPLNGLGGNPLRRKPAGGKKERMVYAILADQSTEHGPMLKKESRKRSKKSEVEHVSRIEPSRDPMKQLLPDGATRRTRPNTRLFSPAPTTTLDGQLAIHEAAGKMCPSRETPLKRGANIIAKPQRQSTRNVPRKFLAEISDKVGEIAEGIRKQGRMRQRQEPSVNEQSSVIEHETVDNKPVRRSTRNSSKTNLPLDEPPVIDFGLAVPEAPESEIDPSCKEVKEMSNEVSKVFDVTKQLESVRVSTVKEVIDVAPNLEGQLSTCAKFKSTSMHAETLDTVVEVIVKKKESNIVEEDKETLPEQNVKGDEDDHSCLNSSGDFDDYNLVEPVEDTNNLTDVGLISPVKCFSPTYQADSEGECSNPWEVNEELETENSMVGKGVNPGSYEVDDQSAEDCKANVQGNQSLVELDPNENSEPVQDHQNEIDECQNLETNSDNSQEAGNLCPIVPYDFKNEMVQEIHFDEIVPGDTVVPSTPALESQDGNQHDAQIIADSTIVERSNTYTRSYGIEVTDETTDVEVSLRATDEKAEQTSAKMISDHKVEDDVFKEEGKPMSLPHFTLEKLQEGKECDSPIASDENVSASYEVIKEESNFLVETAVDNHIDTSLDLTRSASFGADDLLSMDGKATVEDNVGRMESELKTKDYYSEREKEDDVAVTTDTTPCNMDDSLTGGGVLDMNGSNHGVILNHAHENIRVLQSAADATYMDERVDCKNIENTIKWDAENFTEVKLSIDTDSPEACSRISSMLIESSSLGDRAKSTSKSKACKNNENLSGATNGLNQENSATTPQFSEALLNDYKNVAEDAAFMDNISNQPLCNRSENNAKQIEEALDDYHAANNKPNQSDDIKEVGVFANLSILSPMKPNMDVDCFVPSPASPTSLSANFEQSAIVSERQLGEHELHTDPLDSKELISVAGESLNDQDDVSAIIQEYLDHENHMKELIKNKDLNAFVHEGRIARVADIKVNDNCAVEEAETNNTVEHGIDNMLKDSGEEDKEVHLMTNERMETGEENGEPLLPGAAGDSNNILSVNHEDLETPNEIVKTMLRYDEVKFGDLEDNIDVSTDLDCSASMASDNCVFRDGKTEKNGVNIGGMVGGSISQVISFHDETKLNVDAGLKGTADGINDNLVDKDVYAWNDNGPDTGLVNAQENIIVSTDEAGDQSMEGRISFDSVKDGRDSECHAYKKIVTEGTEGMEMANTDGGIDFKRMDSPIQGNTELGTDQRGSGHHKSTSKAAVLTDDVDCLDLNNLFSSNNKKINFKQTEENMDLLDPKHLEVSFVASKDTADLEELLSTMKPEKGVQCAAVSPVTASSSECISSETESDTLECNAELPSFTGFELNLHSEDSKRDEVERLHARNLKENLMIGTIEKVKKGEDTVVDSSKVSAKQLCHNENGLVVEIEIPKHKHLDASNEPIYENEGSNHNDMMPVITQGCLDPDYHRTESFECEDSKEGTKITGSVFAAPTNTGIETVQSFGVSDRSEDMVELMELKKDISEVNLTNVNVASDESISENGGSTEKLNVFVTTQEKSVELENSVKSTERNSCIYFVAEDSKPVETYSETCVEGITVLIKNDPNEEGMVDTMEVSQDVSETDSTSLYAASDEAIVENGGQEGKCNVEPVSNQETEGITVIKNDFNEDMIETTEFSQGASKVNATSLGAASDEPIIENEGTEENCNVEPVINQEYVDSEYKKDNFVELENSTEMSKDELELKGFTVDQFSASLGNVVALDSRQENSKEANLLESISKSADIIAKKKNKDLLIPATPKTVRKLHDMKENLASTKREQLDNITASKRSVKRRPLENLHNN